MFLVLHPTFRVSFTVQPKLAQLMAYAILWPSLLNCWDRVCTTKPSKAEVLRTDHILALCEDKFNGFADIWDKLVPGILFLQAPIHSRKSSQVYHVPGATGFPEIQTQAVTDLEEKLVHCLLKELLYTHAN